MVDETTPDVEPERFAGKTIDEWRRLYMSAEFLDDIERVIAERDLRSEVVVNQMRLIDNLLERCGATRPCVVATDSTTTALPSNGGWFDGDGNSCWLMPCPECATWDDDCIYLEAVNEWGCNRCDNSGGPPGYVALPRDADALAAYQSSITPEGGRR